MLHGNRICRIAGLAFLSIILATASSMSQAQSDFFAGVSGAYLDYSLSGVPGDAAQTTLNGRIGFFIDEYLSSELRLGFGINEQSLTNDVDARIKTLFGGYLRAGLPNRSALFPYLVLGYSVTDTKISSSQFNFSSSESGVSYGFGVDVDVSPGWTLNGEYMEYVDSGGVEIGGFSVGFSMTF